MSLILKNLSLSFGHEKIFHGLDAELKKGEVVALLGPSGCGKSSLLRVLAGLLNASSGEIVSPPGSQNSKAMVFQEAQLLPWRTARENVALPFEIQKQNPAPDQIQNLFSALGLAGAEEKFPMELSGGMKMRVALARALIQEPELLLLDEPFSALDEITRETLQVLTRNMCLQNKNRVSIFVTHSISEALLMADQILVMGRRTQGFRLKIENKSLPARDIGTLTSQDFFRLQAEWAPKIRQEFL